MALHIVEKVRHTGLDKWSWQRKLGASTSNEIITGCASRLSMAYIAVVNPAILPGMGMGFLAVLVVTCLASQALPLWSRWPTLRSRRPRHELECFPYSHCSERDGNPLGSRTRHRIFVRRAVHSRCLLKVREVPIKAIPESLMYSIATGTTFGLISHALIKLLTGVLAVFSSSPAGHGPTLAIEPRNGRWPLMTEAKSMFP